MKRVALGKTGIRVSRLGIGTGTSHPSGYCYQTLMDRGELARLLLFALERGINFWDTAFQYGTYLHVKEALKRVKRSEIVLATKLTASRERDALRDFDASLKEVGTDYFDICLLHAVRTEAEFRQSAGAFDALLKLKGEGKIRAVGLSSHGLSALKSVLKTPEIDVVWARVNYAGLNMDKHRLGIYDKLASVPWIKRTASVMPKKLISMVRPDGESPPLSDGNRKEIEETIKLIHAQSKGIVGMKILAEGQLRHDSKKAVEYVRDLSFVDSCVIGMLSEDEIRQNCNLFDPHP